MLTTAIGYASIVWVLVSWAKIWITPKMSVYKYLCLKCVTFHVTLLLTFNPAIAAIASLIAMLIDGYENNKSITL